MLNVWYDCCDRKNCDKKNYFKNETYMDESIIHNKLHSEFIVFNML